MKNLAYVVDLETELSARILIPNTTKEELLKCIPENYMKSPYTWTMISNKTGSKKYTMRGDYFATGQIIDMLHNRKIIRLVYDRFRELD